MASNTILFSAVSSSARQLFLLLRCVAFSPMAQAQITPHGFRFSVEDSSSMEAMVLLEKSLFTSYSYNPSSLASSERPADGGEEDDAATPSFEISLSSLLETLQIFGLSDPSYNKSMGFQNRDPFASASLGISSLCRMSYEGSGDPLTIHIEEGSIRTTCELTTYEPSSTSDIPFARDAILLKIIIRGSSLLDAINELSTNEPAQLEIRAVQAKGSFTLCSSSDLGSTLVEFRNPSTRRQRQQLEDREDASATQATILETFQVAGSYVQRYKFSHLLAARKAMAAATKVSIRGDEQGVLSLQFMIENMEGSGVSFVDFRFVPFIEEEGNGESSTEGEDATFEDEDETLR